MFKKHKNIAIAVTIVSLLFVGLIFQNCAAPLDPSLLTDTKTLGSGGDNAPLNFTAQASSSEVEVGQPVFISTEIFSSNGEATVDIYKNGNKIASGLYYQVPSVALGDNFKVVVTDNTGSQERFIILSIKQPGGPVDPPIGGTGKAYLKNIDGTMPFKKHLLSHGAKMTFSVELDFPATDTSYTNASISWEKRSVSDNEIWNFIPASPNLLEVTGSYTTFEQNYRAVAKYQGEVVGISDVITIVTKSYNSANTTCAAPFVIAGIAAYNKLTVKSNRCKEYRSNECEEYYYDSHYRPRSVICKLPQKASMPDDYIGSTQLKSTVGQYKNTLKKCNGTAARKTSLITALDSTNMMSNTMSFYCTELTLGSSYIFEKDVINTLSREHRVCPEYQYLVGLHRHKSYYRYGVFEKLVCAEIF